MDRIERALDLFHAGYNCAQSVVGAYSDLFGVDQQTGLRFSAGMGGGMGGLRGKCGAVTGMFLLAGLKCGSYPPEDLAAKRALYDLVKRLNAEFEERLSTSNCRELLERANVAVAEHPSARSAEYYRKRPCALFVETACEIVERNLR